MLHGIDTDYICVRIVIILLVCDLTWLYLADDSFKVLIRIGPSISKNIIKFIYGDKWKKKDRFLESY